MSTLTKLAPGDGDVVERLARLRSILPLMAHDLATARRRVVALEVENRQLRRRIRELEAGLATAPREPARVKT